MRAGYQERRLWLALVGLCLILRGGAVEAGEGDEDLLRRQVKYLTEALAKAKADTDNLRARLDNRAYEAAGGRSGSSVSPASVREKEYRILDVNKELGMVVLNGGRQDGLKPGLQFAVIQKDRAVATVRVVDVRAAVAGAVIQKAGRALPRVQDRAVVVTGSGD